MNVLVTGASGLIGTALVERLTHADHTVTRLVRGGPAGPVCGRSDERRGLGSDVRDDRPRGPRAGRAVRRSGQPGRSRHRGPALVRWRARSWSVGSRVSATSLLAGSLLRLSTPPPVLVSASAVGFYGDRGDEELTETSTSGTGFLASVCRAWEAEARPAADAGIRTVLLRSGIVLSRQGGALGRLLPIFRVGPRGPHRHRARSTAAGSRSTTRSAPSCTASGTMAWPGPSTPPLPTPATDADLARALGAALHRPSALAVPAGGPPPAPRDRDGRRARPRRPAGAPGHPAAPGDSNSPTPTSTKRSALSSPRTDDAPGARRAAGGQRVAGARRAAGGRRVAGRGCAGERRGAYGRGNVPWVTLPTARWVRARSEEGIET